MRILLSAFACQPNHGSEPGVGWYWALELSRLGHDVTVLTRHYHRPAIEQSPPGPQPPGSLEFVYYDLPEPLGRIFGRPLGSQLYCLMWQVAVVRVASRLDRLEPFDMIHHVTYGALRYPTFLGWLGKPLLIGPVGGGDEAPRRLLKGASRRVLAWESLRSAVNLVCRFDPISRWIFGRAALVATKTPQSRECLPAAARASAVVAMEIGVGSVPADEAAAPRDGGATGPFTVLYVGRFEFWKGMALGLRAFARFQETCPESRLLMVGEGPEEARWRALAVSLGVAGCVDWVGRLPQPELFRLYGRGDLLLFPSLRDSSGNVVLEALARGLPVVCLDLAGPPAIVGDRCGKVVPVGGLDFDGVVEALARAIAELAGDPGRLAQFRESARERAGQLTWRAAVLGLYRHWQARTGLPASG